MNPQPNPSWTRPLAVAVTMLFLLGVVGSAVVDSGGGNTALTVAAEATTAEGSARMTMEMAIELNGDRSTVSAEGLVDFSGERAQMTMRSSALSGPMELLSEGTTVYVRATLPEIQAQAGGKPWVSYDASAYAQGPGGSGFGSDPRAMLRLLERRGIARDVRTTGSEQVRGTPTTRYTADLDVQEFVRSFQSPQFDAVADNLEGAEATMDVWAAAGDIVRRSSMALRFRLGSASYDMTVTMELFDFGIPVGIAVPPADQVQQVKELIQSSR